VTKKAGLPDEGSPAFFFFRGKSGVPFRYDNRTKYKLDMSPETSFQYALQKSNYPCGIGLLRKKYWGIAVIQSCSVKEPRLPAMREHAAHHSSWGAIQV